MGPVTPPVPHMPQGYPPRPRVTAADIRYEWELASNVGTIAVGVVLLLLIGQLVNMLVAAIIPIGFALLGMVFVNLSNKGSMVQVSEVQFPHLHRLAQEVAHNLDMQMPAIFVTQSPVVNAYATGLFGQRTVVLHSALLEQMTLDEVKSVIAHEFGHIKLNHIMYGILQNITVSGFLGGLIFMPIKWLFFFASRAAEYSADQAALVGTMNIQACVTSEIKLAVGAKLYEQMNIQAYLLQIEEFSHTTGSKFIEILNDATHPMTVNRILHVIRFYRSPKYQQLAAAHGRSGTTTLTSGHVGTRDLFQRVASKAEYDRDMQRATAGMATPQPTVPQATHQQAAPSYMPPAPAQLAYAVAPPSISCGGCGMPLDANARFCNRCGTPVGGMNAQPAPQASFQPLPTEQAPGGAQPTPVGPAEQPAVRVVRRVVRSGEGTVPEQAMPPAPPVPAATAPAVCRGCGQPVAADTKFCANCGQPTT